MPGVLPVNPLNGVENVTKPWPRPGLLPVNPLNGMENVTKTLAIPGIQNLPPMSPLWRSRAILIPDHDRYVI